MKEQDFLAFCEEKQKKGYVGSFSVKTGEEKDKPIILFSGNDSEKKLHIAIYEMDPEYKCVAILQKGYSKNIEELPVISEAENLDDAILFKGIGHTKAFVLKESNAVVVYSYSLEEFLE